MTMFVKYQEVFMKSLQCKDVGFDCGHVIRAESKAEVLRQATEHAQEVHDTQVTPEIAEKVKSVIREE
jgi:predicted small metal-binding protein